MSRRLKALAAGVVAAAALAGCSGGLSTSSPVAPERYQSLRPQSGNTVLIELPGASGFAIHDKTSQQSPGQDGKAASTADAAPDGTAHCGAAVAAGGAASGSFALGAALYNDTSAPLPVAVTCDVEYEYAVKIAAASGGRKTSGQLTFQMEAREQSTGKILSQHPLASLSGFEDDLKRSDQQRLQFTATISPQARWQIVLQGKADAQAGSDGQADVQLRMTSCKMTIKERPAAATQP